MKYRGFKMEKLPKKCHPDENRELNSNLAAKTFDLMCKWERLFYLLHFTLKNIDAKKYKNQFPPKHKIPFAKFILIGFLLLGLSTFFVYGVWAQINSWIATSSLIEARVNHSSVINNNKIYVIGGWGGSTGITTTVWFTPINSDGSVGSWMQTTSLPAPRSECPSVVYNNKIYVVGGWDGSPYSAYSTVYYASINSDGTINSWATTTPLPAGRRLHQVLLYNEKIYVIGGENGNANEQSSVWYSSINADGSLGSWNTTTSLPVARSGHSINVYNGKIYVIGGQVDTVGYSTVYYANINNDGTLGSWNTTTPLSQVCFFHSSVIVGDKIYVPGGDTGNNNAQATVYYTTINGDGTLGSWNTTTSLPAGRKEYSAVVNGNKIYIIGGYDFNARSTVYYAILPIQWQHEKEIRIDNTNNSNALSDYQILITLDTLSLISSGKMKSDCGDIRFIDSDGKSILNYWIEDGINTSSTKIWVKIPNIPNSASKTIYLRYGNPQAESMSNIKTTFIIGDEFDTWDRNIWGTQPSWTSLDNGILTISANTNALCTKTTLGQGYQLMVKAKQEVLGHITFGWANSTLSEGVFIRTTTGDSPSYFRWHTENNGWGSWSYIWNVNKNMPLSDTIWHKFIITRKSITENLYQIDSNTVETLDRVDEFYPNDKYIPTSSLPVNFSVLPDGVLKVDWIAVRKYTPIIEPSISIDSDLNTDIIPQTTGTNDKNLYAVNMVPLNEVNPPISAIISPVSLGYNYQVTICGTASDKGSGILKVLVKVADATTDTKFLWDGKVWQSENKWLVAEGSSNWKYSGIPYWSKNRRYTVWSKAFDNYGNTEEEKIGNTFWYDQTIPASAVLLPKDGETYSSLPTITGIANDTVSGLGKVELLVKNETDGKFFDGNNWIGSEIWLKAEGLNEWFINSPQWTDGKKYLIRSKATDISGNAETPSSGVSFNYIGSSRAIALPNDSTDEQSSALQLQEQTTGFVIPEPMPIIQVIPTDYGTVIVKGEPSPTEGVIYYRVYYDNGEGKIDFSKPIGNFSDPKTGWESPNISPGRLYSFFVQPVIKDVVKPEILSDETIPRTPLVISGYGNYFSVSVPSTNEKPVVAIPETIFFEEKIYIPDTKITILEEEVVLAFSPTGGVNYIQHPIHIEIDDLNISTTPVKNLTTVVIPYNDFNQDGFVDGTDVPEKSLIIRKYDIATKQWLSNFDTEIDTERNICVANVKTSGTYALFSPYKILPAPVKNLSGEVVNHNQAKISWGHSSTLYSGKYNLFYDNGSYYSDNYEGNYRLYWDDGSGNINYSAPVKIVSPPESSWTSQSLSVGTYKFAVRVANKQDEEEKNNNFVLVTVNSYIPPIGVTPPLIVSTGTAVDVQLSSPSTPSTPTVTPTIVQPKPKATIKVPLDGKRIRGNAVTVMAEANGDTKGVLFQYKSADSNNWIDITSIDRKLPYSVYWNVSALKNGPYNLRAVAFDSKSQAEGSPEFITVYVDDVNWDIVEDGNPLVDPNNEHRKQEKIDSTKDAEVVIADGTKAVIPAGTVDDKTVLIVSEVKEEKIKDKLPVEETSLEPIGEFRSYEFSNDKKSFDKEITITIPYKDEDENGLVDGTNIKKDELKIFYLKEETKEWKEVVKTKNHSSAKSVSPTENKNYISAQVNHFTIFGIFAYVPSQNLANLIVYPNPYKPNSGLGHTIIVFDGLTENVKLQVFTITGRLVREFDATTSGNILWDVKNSDGEDVASGVYIYLVNDKNGKGRTRGKLAVLR